MRGNQVEKFGNKQDKNECPHLKLDYPQTMLKKKFGIPQVQVLYSTIKYMVIKEEQALNFD